MFCSHSAPPPLYKSFLSFFLFFIKFFYSRIHEKSDYFDYFQLNKIYLKQIGKKSLTTEVTTLNINQRFSTL